MFKAQWPKDTKWVMRISKSKKNRKHNGLKKRDKRTINDLQNIISGVAAYTLSRHGVHIDRLKKNEKKVLLLLAV